MLLASCNARGSVTLTNKDPNKVVSLSWAAINAGDRVNSSLKDMAVVMKQLDGADEAIELIKSFRHLYPYDSRESIENVLVELYKGNMNHLKGSNLNFWFRRRLEKHIYIPFQILRVVRSLLGSNLKTIELGPLMQDIDEVARRTEGYSEDALTNV
ncbi:hypothetical protein NC652_037300 [Populus alba x Populus x berolinensis]|nr:hypothetical protein NC652_037300 [Populus alba x Populus x berolinensis]